MSAHNLLMAAAGASGGSSNDAQFKYVTALLHGDGTNGAQNNSFVEESSSRTITVGGTASQGSFGPFGALWSNYFDGSSNIVGSMSSAIGTGDFTVEFWVYVIANTGLSGEGGFFQTTSSSTGLSTSEYGASSLTMQRNSGTNTYGFAVGATTVAFSNSGTYQNQWMHVACVRSSGTVRIYLNGVLNSTPTTVTTNLTGTYIGIGGYYSGSYLINAYISNFRITNTVVYSGAFTPPTTPLTAISGTLFLGCQSNRFLNTSSGAAMTINTGTPSVQRFSPFSPTAAYDSSVIGGSAYFDGSTYLQMPSSTDFNCGTGDFTLEFWCYRAAGVAGTLITRQSSSSGWNNIQWYLSCDSSGYMTFTNSTGSGNANFWSSGVLTGNAWSHVAIVRSSGTWYIYLNGVSQAKANGTGISNSMEANATGQPLNIGGFPGWGYMTGYLSGVKFVPGQVLYPSGTTFTPPTAPASVTTGTKVLCNMKNGAVIDNAMMVDFATVGTAQISTSQKKYGTGSIFINGSGNYLKAPNTLMVVLASGDFTIEMWVYPTTTGTYRRLLTLANGTAANSNYSYTLDINTSEKLVGQVFDGSTQHQSASSGSVTTNAWNHVAFVKNGNSVKVYLNGTGATAATPTVFNAIADGKLWIGVDADGSGTPFTGYIDDLRITKGYARYTSNFTPPAAALPDQ